MYSRNKGKLTVSSQNSKLQAALTVVKAAQAKAENKEFPPALEKYELALGALIPLLQKEVKSRQSACEAIITITTSSRKEGLTSVLLEKGRKHGIIKHKERAPL